METCIPLSVLVSRRSTDPTYKEWKQAETGDFYIISPSCTDPTYKEWKQPTVLVWEEGAVARILPTRNGNNARWQFALARCPKHGSYLQGMETPMDDLQAPLSFTPHGSYLQGMETPQGYRPSGLPLRGTDPTYKEWKP